MRLKRRLKVVRIFNDIFSSSLRPLFNPRSPNSRKVCLLSIVKQCPVFINITKTCYKHIILLLFLLLLLLSANTYIQEQTDTNSPPHLYANCMEKSLATLSQTWVKICFPTAVFSEKDLPQGLTWRCCLGFLLVTDATAPSSSEPPSDEWRLKSE